MIPVITARAARVHATAIAARETPVKLDTLSAASLLSVILLPFHVGGDIARGFDRGGPGLFFVVVPILLALTCGALLLAGRRSGYIIMFLGGLAALGMPLIHRNNGFTATVARSPGGLFFIWTLVTLGVTGGLAMILSARGLWQLRSTSRGSP
jgi:hypothetical protein